MTFLRGAWKRVRRAFVLRRPRRQERWVQPASAITRAIAAGTVEDLPLARRRRRYRSVSLADFPDYADALREAEAERARAERARAVAAREAAAAAASAPPPAPGRKPGTVSTRSARRRRHHAA